MFAVALLAGKRAVKRRPSGVIRLGFLLLTAGLVVLLQIVPRADSGWASSFPSWIAGRGWACWCRSSTTTRSRRSRRRRVNEAAGVNSAAGSFGLSFGLAFAGAIMLATLSIAFTNKAEASKVLPPADQQQVADALEDDAEVEQHTSWRTAADEPEPIRDEIIRINTDARPLALQVALLIPILAGLVGLLNSFRMMRQPDPTPSSAVEGGMVAG